MNSFKTELFNISFLNDSRADKAVLIEWIKGLRCGEYSELKTLATLCLNVDDKLQNFQLSPSEAVKIISKSASFFMLP